MGQKVAPADGSVRSARNIQFAGDNQADENNYSNGKYFVLCQLIFVRFFVLLVQNPNILLHFWESSKVYQKCFNLEIVIF